MTNDAKPDPSDDALAENEAADAPSGPTPGGGGSDEPDAASQRDEYHDLLLRKTAEFDNYRRRVQAQLGESQARAQAELVGKILGVVDDLRRVTHVDPEMASVESVLEGVRHLERKLLQSLSDAGLDELDPSGEPFDPNTMEAMTRVPAASEAEDDTVAEVFQRGFRFRGRGRSGSLGRRARFSRSGAAPPATSQAHRTLAADSGCRRSREPSARVAHC